MSQLWFQHDQQTVEAALRRGERPDLVSTMSSGPLDELVALHDELAQVTLLAVREAVV